MNWMKDWIFFFLSFFLSTNREPPLTFLEPNFSNFPCEATTKRSVARGRGVDGQEFHRWKRGDRIRIAERAIGQSKSVIRRLHWSATTSVCDDFSARWPIENGPGLIVTQNSVVLFFYIYISSSLPAFSFWSPPMKTWLDAPFDSVTRYYGRFHCGAHETWPISVIRFSVAPPKRQQILKATRSISTTSPPPKKKIPVFFLLILSFFLYEDEQEDSSGNRRSHRLRWRSKVQCRVQLRQTPWRRSFAADHAMAPSTATAEFQEVASSALDVIA